MPTTERYSSASGNQPTITRTITKSVVPVGCSDLVDPDVVLSKKHEEWTTSKRIVNHKTKQVETRVQRQLILEDGRVVADSGPQVTTKTKEDCKTEESENTEHKTTGDDAPGVGYALVPGSAKVICEKTESNQTMTETREENRQMHDENMVDLSGEEIHQRAIIAPDDPSFGHNFGEFKGKLTHFSSRSQKIVDKDEVKEVSELKDGEVTTETVRTHHHEEAYDDEVPEEEAEPGMVPERSAETNRTIQYYTNPKDFEDASTRLQEESRRSRAINHSHETSNPAVAHRWVDDHFGDSRPREIDNGPRSESTRMKSGGNRITIEMSGHRSSPSDLSPRSTLRKDRSRDSTLRNRSSSTGFRSPSPTYNHNTFTRVSTASPFELSSSSGSSRSKTPVKTFYLGEDNSYMKDSHGNWKKKVTNNNSFSSIDTSSLGRSNLSGYYGERSDSFCRVPRSKLTDPVQYDSFNNGVVYSKMNRIKTDKNVQAALSDDDDDDSLKKRAYRQRSLSPKLNGINGISNTTFPRTVKITQEPSPKYSTNPLSNSKYYKSSDSLHGYHSNNNYGYNYPIYNNVSKLTNGSDVFSKNYRNSKTHEIKVQRDPNWYFSRKIPTSPPESGYQSPFPPTPPSSPPPRVYFGSSPSPPSSPVHHTTASIRKKSAYPSGSASRSKSSSDLRTQALMESYTPLASPLKLKTVGDKQQDGQKYYRVKPGHDGQSVIVQVRDWNSR